MKKIIHATFIFSGKEFDLEIITEPWIRQVLKDKKIIYEGGSTVTINPIVAEADSKKVTIDFEFSDTEFDLDIITEAWFTRWMEKKALITDKTGPQMTVTFEVRDGINESSTNSGN